MATLLKNQILKHLSKFTKDLSADKISLSTLKGEGELTDLELNEDVLTQLLDLPTWLKITRAVCTKVTIKIQWTKLKSQPICLFLDEVIVEVKTCERPRPPNNHSLQFASGKYGFVEKVMDGIYVHVSSVLVKLITPKFLASLQLSRVRVQSVSPTWHFPHNLRCTRIQDRGRGQVLLFKEIEWQTTRIEIKAAGSEEAITAPLRLIANQSKIRICVKKRLSDSVTIASRLTLLLDDILWVLTITQLKAAALYASSLKEVIEGSAQQSKRFAADKLKKQTHKSSSSEVQHQQQQSTPSKPESATAKYFSQFDVASTSYHLITSRFDLHLCDDGGPDLDRKTHWKISGGSMQTTFSKLSISFYPFNLAGGERKSWYRYTDSVGSRSSWVKKLFAEFRDNAVKLRKVCESSPLPSSASAPSLLFREFQDKASVPSGLSFKGGEGANKNQPSRSAAAGSKAASSSPLHQNQVSRLTRLLESCLVIKAEDATVGMVTTPGRKQTGPNKFVCSDKRELLLPQDTSVFHIEYTDYFFPEGLDYPVPDSNLYVLLNPVRVTLDFLTLLWADVFLLPLTDSLGLAFGDQMPKEHIDIKIELLMPRVILPAENRLHHQQDFPDAIQLQVSKLVITNQRTEEKMSRDDLKSVLDEHKKAKLFSCADFPNDESQGDLEVVPEILCDHAASRDNPYIDKNVKTLLDQSIDQVSLSSPDFNQSLHHSTHSFPSHHLNSHSLKRLAASDVWSASAEHLWVEFLNRNRPASFVNAIPVTVWLCVTHSTVSDHESTSSSSFCARDNALKTKEVFQEKDRTDHEPERKIFMLARIWGKLFVQLNHFQYIFMLSLLESFSALQADLSTYHLSVIPHHTSHNPLPIIIMPVVLEELECAIVYPCSLDEQTSTDDAITATWPAMASDVSGLHEKTLDQSLIFTAGQCRDEFVPAGSNITDYSHTLPYISGSEPSVSDNSKNYAGLASQSPSLLEKDSGIALEWTPHVYHNSFGGGAGGPHGKETKNVKKAFSSAFSSLADKLKSKTEFYDDSSELDDDTSSLNTDTSDDDFEHMSLDDLEEAPAFSNGLPLTDTASLLDDYSRIGEIEGQTSLSAECSITKRKEMINVMLFKLDHIEMVLESHGNKVVAKAQLAKLGCSQQDNISYEDFQINFQKTKGLIYNNAAESQPHMYPIQLKLEASLPDDTLDPAVYTGHLIVHASDFSLSFKMSGLDHLMKFSAGNGNPLEFLPMTLEISNLLLVLEEDRLPLCVGSGVAAPVNIHIQHMLIETDKHGVFSISAPASSRLQQRTSTPTSSDSLMDLLRASQNEVVSLKHQLKQSQMIAGQYERQILHLQNGHGGPADCGKETESSGVCKDNVHGNIARSMSICPSSTGQSSTDIDQLRLPLAHPAIHELEHENLCLHQKLIRLEDKLLSVTKEKESLLQTLQLLQGELLTPQHRGSKQTDLTIELSQNTPMPM